MKKGAKMRNWGKWDHKNTEKKNENDEMKHYKLFYHHTMWLEGLMGAENTNVKFCG